MLFDLHVLMFVYCLWTPPHQTAILLLRIDDIVSGHKKKDSGEQMGGGGAE